MSFNEEELRVQAVAYAALPKGSWVKLANAIKANPGNLTNWGKGRGCVARAKLAKIPAAIERLSAKQSEGGSK